MVSGVNSDSFGLQQLMTEMYQKINSADTDGVAGLSKEELSSVDLSDSPFVQALTKNFDKVDTDGDGQISEKDLSSIRLEPLGPPPGFFIEGEHRALSGVADTDNQKGFSKEELSALSVDKQSGKARFIDNLVSNFDSIDKDGNGQLTHKEIAAFKLDKLHSESLGSSEKPQDVEGAQSNALSKDSLGDFTSAFLQKLINSYKDGTLSNLASSIISA